MRRVPENLKLSHVNNFLPQTLAVALFPELLLTGKLQGTWLLTFLPYRQSMEKFLALLAPIAELGATLKCYFCLNRIC